MNAVLAARDWLRALCQLVTLTAFFENIGKPHSFFHLGADLFEWIERCQKLFYSNTT